MLFQDWLETTKIQAKILDKIFKSCGFTKVEWKFPEETGFYQPIVIAINSSRF